MEERFEVLAGVVAFLVDGERRDATVGNVVTVPLGATHLAWNPGNDQVRVQIEMRPPLRWKEFTRRLFAGEPATALVDEFSDEIVIPDR